MDTRSNENIKALEPVFRFWGFSRITHHDMVGPGCVINSENLSTSYPHYGTLRFARDVSELICPEAHGPCQARQSWLYIDPSIQPEGQPLAWLEMSNHCRYPIITRTSDNDYHFWFDVDRTIRFVLNEEHLRHTAPLYVRLGINPHHLPRRMRDLAFHGMHTLRRLSHSNGSIGKGLATVDLWRGLIRHIVELRSDTKATPCWPDGKQYACTASHDLDTVDCFIKPKYLNQFRTIDDEMGMRTAWMVVTRNIKPGRLALDDLHAYGHEIGFHGTAHDHRLAFASPIVMARRVAEVKELISCYQTDGFRSPAYLRSLRLFRALDGVLAYDMSMHDAIEGVCRPSPANEGCGTCYPFFIRGTNLLEIPTTVPEDWQFDLMGIRDCNTILSVQKEKLARIKQRGGIANVLTHTEPAPSTKPYMVEAYRQLMAYMASDEQAWFATPGEINRWWRVRIKSIDRLWEQGIAYPPVSASVRDIFPATKRRTTVLQ